MDPVVPLSEAAKHSWEAVLLVFIIIGGCGTVAWLFKSWVAQAVLAQQDEAKRAAAREDRLSARITRLEEFVETTLMDTVRNSCTVMAQCSAALAELKSTLQRTEQLLVLMEARKSVKKDDV